MSTHTPGPWIVKWGSKGYARAVDAPGDADIQGAVGRIVRWNGLGMPASETGKANARLVAAAPDMLAALKRLIVIYKNDGHARPCDCPACAGKAAIAKAEGRMP
jgi:hypothetical protein